MRKIQAIGKSVFAIFPALRETGEDRQLGSALVGQASILEHNTSFIASEHCQRAFESHSAA